MDNLDLQLSSKLRIEEKPLGSLCKALTIGLVSFSVSHTNRFDPDIFNKAIKKFNIGSGLNFSLRSLASLQDYLGEPVWVLGKNQSAQNLGLSIDVEDFAVLWGPFWVYESFIKTERRYLVPAEPSGVRTGEEIKCRWTKQPPRSDIPRPSKHEILIKVHSVSVSQSPHRYIYFLSRIM